MMLHFFEGIQNVEISMDDIVIGITDSKLHLRTVKKVLDICKADNITPNKEKYQIPMTERTFLDDRLTANGLKPDPVNS